MKSLQINLYQFTSIERSGFISVNPLQSQHGAGKNAGRHDFSVYKIRSNANYSPGKLEQKLMSMNCGLISGKARW